MSYLIQPNSFHRDDLHCIKSGEEDKKKFYRALCTLRDNDIINEKMLEKLDINEAFDIQQLTPLRVLHRRTLMKRTRTVHSVKAYAVKGNYSHTSNFKKIYLSF